MILAPATALIVALQTVPPPPSARIVEPIVYFQSGSARPLPLNDSNLDVIRRFASRPDVNHVIIRAYADTVGSGSANMALSERRGRAIAEWLIQDGVAEAIIRIIPYGETHLARPTDDGVDEPLNRRVWVDFDTRD